LKHLKTLALVLFIFVICSNAFGWTKELYSQLIKDAILLSPPEIQVYFSAGKDALETSLDRLVQGKYGKDPQDAFVDTIVALRETKREPQTVVARLLDLAWYVSDAAKPALDKYKLALVVQRTECLCVLFDGYQEFTKFNEVLTNEKKWLANSVGMVEEFYMFGEREFEAEAARSIEVIYNSAVNIVVDAWYSAFVIAQVPAQPVQAEGAQIFPKGMKPPLMPIELQFRMNGFKKAVYGEQEAAIGQKELLIEQIVKQQKTGRQKSEKAAKTSAKSGKKGETPKAPGSEEAVSLDALMGAQGANVSPEIKTQQPAVGEGNKQPAGPASEAQKATTQTAPAETKEQKTQPSGEQATKQAEVKKQTEQGKPQENEISAEVQVSGKEGSDLVEMAKKAQGDVGTVGSGGAESVNLDALLSTPEKTGAQTTEQKDLKPKSGETAPKTEEINVKLESLNAKQSGKLSEKSEIRVESPVMVPATNGTPQGDLKFDLISQVLSDNIGGIKFCYELGLKRNPALSGKVEVEFTIDESGKVESADVISSTLKDTRVQDCILRKIRSLKFPQPSGGKVTVKFPFVFEQSTYF